MSDHDAQECVETICPVFVGDSCRYVRPVHSFSPFPDSARVLVRVPFGHGLSIDPVWGNAVVRHAVRTGLPSLPPSAVLTMAKAGKDGFRVVEEKGGA